MSDHLKNGSGKKRWFPSVAGVIGGMIPGLAALFNEVSSPFWITWNVIVIVAAFGFAAVNLIGLAIVRYRNSTNPDAYDR